MSLITISRGSYSRGEPVAKMVAAKLGYECIGREVLLEASKEFNIPEVGLVRAIHDAPSILERFTFGREKYIAFIQAAILKHFLKDNVVYHGLAGHFFVPGISHVLKVRIIADMEDRVRREMEAEGISQEEALRILKRMTAKEENGANIYMALTRGTLVSMIWLFISAGFRLKKRLKPSPKRYSGSSFKLRLNPGRR